MALDNGKYNRNAVCMMNQRSKVLMVPPMKKSAWDVKVNP